MLDFTTLPTDVLKAFGDKIQTFLKANTDVPHFFEDSREEELGPNTIEIRLDGPHIDEIANGQYHIRVDVDLLVTLEIKKNVFVKSTVLGVCQEALNEDVPFSVDGVSVGCFSKAIPFGGSEKITLENFGQVHKDRRVTHSAVSTTFHILI